MTTPLSIEVPFPVFQDRDGQPLENGYVWLGVANLNPQTNPIIAYFDKALTIPAAQPLRTINGYISNAGTPAQVYVDGVNFSILVQDSKGSMVYNFPDGTGISPDACGVIYDPPFIGGVAYPVCEKLAQTVSVKDFGAVGDGVADDTAAVHAAIDVAKNSRGSVYFPAGIYRVTSGYTQSVNYRDVRLYGDGSTRETVNSSSNEPSGSHIRLDSTDPNSFFYRVNARHHLQVENLLFSCAQYVLDRKFFAFNAPLSPFTLDNLNFESVEKPICFEPNCYFQSSTINNVQFRSSGTIYSELGEDLRATLLILTDVHHEGVVPINTAKIVCDLSGVRKVMGTNFLLEGAVPTSGWTILKLNNPYDQAFISASEYIFNNYWSEWGGGINPTYDVDIASGEALFIHPRFAIDPNRSVKNKLGPFAKLIIDGISFSGATEDYFNTFEFPANNVTSKVLLRNLQSRAIIPFSNPNFIFENARVHRSAGAGEVIFGGAATYALEARCLYNWDGGYFDPALITRGTFRNTYTPSVDATYGRKLIFSHTPSTEPVTVSLNVLIPTGVSKLGQQYNLVLKGKGPTTVDGFYIIGVTRNGTGVGSITTLVTTTENPFEILFSFVDTVGGATSVGINIFASGVTDTTNNVIEIYEFEISTGRNIKSSPVGFKPNNIITFSSAIPTIGQWKRGDIIYNSSPSALGTPAWSCVTSGTPGTWSAMANLV